MGRKRIQRMGEGVNSQVPRRIYPALPFAVGVEGGCERGESGSLAVWQSGSLLSLYASAIVRYVVLRPALMTIVKRVGY